MNWYIDSWSPTEGVVFASNRASSNDPWDVDLVQTVMMAAPYFEPHDVSRAMAFGAAQRGFQEQFSVQGEQETGFSTLELLTLFVRRTYSGSGSGPEGNGGDDGGNGGDGDGGINGTGDDRERTQQFGREQQDRDRPQVDWPSLKESDDAPKIGALLSEIQPLNFAQRMEKLLDLIRRQDAGYLRHAREILFECAHDIHEPSRENYRLRRIAHLLFLPEHADIRWYPLHEGNDSLSLALKAPLPKDYASIVGLPLRVKTMMDALSFLAADRRFLGECSVNRILPLLLAIAANFCSGRAIPNWHRYSMGHRELLIKECCDFILRWLPIDNLPDPLESIVSDWSNLKTAAQRRR